MYTGLHIYSPNVHVHMRTNIHSCQISRIHVFSEYISALHIHMYTHIRAKHTVGLIHTKFTCFQSSLPLKGNRRPLFGLSEVTSTVTSSSMDIDTAEASGADLPFKLTCLSTK